MAVTKKKTATKKAVQSKEVKEKVYLTALAIDRGLISLINEDGTIGYFLQRGVHCVSEEDRAKLVYKGLLVPNYKNFKELPANYKLEFEEPDIQGRARVSFYTKEQLKKILG